MGTDSDLPDYAEALIGKGCPENQTSKAKIKYTASNFKIHTFHSDMNDKIISFHVIKMKESLFMWIGNGMEPTFADLSVAMMSKFQNTPLSSKVLGSSLETASLNLSNKLAKKLEKQVYVSLNIPLDRFSLPLIDKCISEELKRCPNMF